MTAPHKHRTEIGKRRLHRHELVAGRAGEDRRRGLCRHRLGDHRDVPADALALGRGRQVIKEGWAARCAACRCGQKKAVKAGAPSVRCGRRKNAIPSDIRVLAVVPSAAELVARRSGAEEGYVASCAGSSASSVRRRSRRSMVDALKRLEYRGYDSAGVATLEDGRLDPPPRRRQAHNLETRLSSEPLSRHHRHRPHALGDPWPSERAQRPSPCDRPRRRRPQRHHREFPRAARRARAGRRQVFETETDTEVVAQLVTEEMTQGHDAGRRRRRGAAAAQGRLRARLPVLRRGGPADRRARAARRSPSATARARCISARMRSRSRRSPTGSPISRTAIGPCSPAAARTIRDAAGKAVTRAGEPVDSAAASWSTRATTAISWRRRSTSSPRSSVTRSPTISTSSTSRIALPGKLPFDFASDRRALDLGLRHRLLRRAGRRNTGSSASRGCRSKSISPRSSAIARRRSKPGTSRCSSRNRARPPTRWRRCAMRSEQKQHSVSIVNVRDVDDRPRERRGDADARRPGDRRRLDQGLHLPARGVRLPRASRPAARAACIDADDEEKLVEALNEMPRQMAEALALEQQIEKLARDLVARAATCSISAAARASRSRSKARSSSRRSPTSTRKAMRPESSSTARSR